MIDVYIEKRCAKLSAPSVRLAQELAESVMGFEMEWYYLKDTIVGWNAADGYQPGGKPIAVIKSYRENS